MADLTDLNPLSPTGADPVSGGDNELRALKNALVGDGTAGNGSFTPTFTGQYTGTAADLNVTKTLADSAAQATDGISYFDDVNTAGAVAGDLLKYNGTDWVAVPPLSGSANYTGYAGLYGAQMYFTTEVTNTVPAGLATIVNGDGINGWFITAVQDCLVNVSTYLSFGFNVPSAPGLAGVKLGHVIDPPNTTFYNTLMAGEDSFFANSAGGYSVETNAQSSIVLLAGEELNVCASFFVSGATPGARNTRLTVNVQSI